jgi:hypothetical protein
MSESGDSLRRSREALQLSPLNNTITALEAAEQRIAPTQPKPTGIVYILWKLFLAPSSPVTTV